MSDLDLVTVVIPAYNAAATIDETLLSVRSQSHRRLEILVVDDGSKDATAHIVQRHCAEDSRIRLIRQRNSGVAAARNRGVAEATGDFVAPIDATFGGPKISKSSSRRFTGTERRLRSSTIGGRASTLTVESSTRCPARHTAGPFLIEYFTIIFRKWQHDSNAQSSNHRSGRL